MCTDFRAFFDNDYRQAVVQLHQTTGGRQSRRAGTNDYDVKFHRLAFRFV